jgi:2-polyprenyl-6-methoxyphenol hydroxylase-like FAD-dependent oxidoreductase
MKVLIIGGGIGGLTASIALRRKGIEADVYERSPILREVGAGISLWPNAVKALTQLGLGERLRSISRQNADFALRRWNGAVIACTPVQELERRFGGGVLIFHRAELLDILAESLGKERLHLGHACAQLKQNASGVSVQFANGETAKGGVLVGADGLNSVVRTGLGRKDPVRYSGYTAWRSIVRFDGSAILPAETWGCGRRFGILPTRDGQVYWYAASNAPEGERDSDGGPTDTLLSLFKGWHQPIEALIRESGTNVLRNDIYDREPVPSWGKGRVTLLGDAAHPMTPDLGQGACQAIEDALELAKFLHAASNAEAGLKAYELTRVPRTRSVVLTSRRMGRIGQLSSTFLCRLRDSAFRLTPNAVSLRGMAPIVGYEGHLES